MRASNITALNFHVLYVRKARPFLALGDTADNPGNGGRYLLGEDMLEDGKGGGNNDCRRGSAGFNPFFRVEADDMCELPHAPQMHKFDKAILGMYEDWGCVQNKRDFLNVLEDRSTAKVVQRICDELDHEVFNADAGFALFKEELAELWFGRNGAANAFCCVPGNGELRGMYFYGRYSEAQDEQ